MERNSSISCPVFRWGIAERDGPGVYDFGAYKHMLQMCKNAGLKMQVRCPKVLFPKRVEMQVPFGSEARLPRGIFMRI